MDKTEKTIFIGLSAVLAVLTALLICGSGFLSPSRDVNPFDLQQVRTVRIVMAEKDWKWLLANPMSEKYVRADFWFDGRKFSNVAVRPKGNSSLMSVAASGSKRLSLKIDFNFFNSAQTFYGVKKLCLNNGFSDPTFIREVLSYEIFKEMGLPTPRCAFADVYVNNEHLGLYTQVEAIDKTFLARHFDNPHGNLYKPEIGAALLNWTKEDVDKQAENPFFTSRENPNDPLAVRLGGRRLSDLLELLERENTPLEELLSRQAAGPFGGPFGRGFGGPGPGGGFGPNPGNQPQGGFGGPPPGGFVPDPNRPFPPGNVPAPAGPFGPPPGGFWGPPGAFRADPNNPMRPPMGPPGVFPQGPGMPPPFAAGGRFDPNNPPMGFGRRGGRGFGGPPGLGGGPGFRWGNLLDAVGLKTNENKADHTALFRLLEVLNKCPDETFPQEIEKVLDVDQVLRYLAVSVMIVHLDNYIGMGHNYYLYETNGRFTILPWDLNMTFGTFGMGLVRDAADFYIDEPVINFFESRPLVYRLLSYPPYRERYRQYLKDLLDGPFAEGVLEERIDRLAALVRPYVEKDELKFFTLEDFEKGLNEGSAFGGGWGGWMRPPAGNQNPPGPMEPQGQRPAPEERAAGGGRFGFGRRGPGFGGPPGMQAPGLKSFIAKRRLSVRRQLSGEIPSRPTEEERQQMMPRFPGMPPIQEGNR
ncbi:MAG: CotH kinase family protein [Anaerohalosphaeraceae bacterium]